MEDTEFTELPRRPGASVKLVVVYISRAESGCIAYCWGAAGACLRLLKERPDVDVQLFSDTHHLAIDDKRDMLLREAYKKECDALIMIDDDMALRPDSLIHLVDFWLARKHEGPLVVAAAYTGKSEKHVMMYKHDDLKAVTEYSGEPVRVYMAGTGLMLIDTRVVPCFDGDPLFLLCSRKGVLTQTEDYYFTEMCSLKKIPVYVIPPIVPHVRYFQAYPAVAADEGGHVGGGLIFFRVGNTERYLPTCTLGELVLLFRSTRGKDKEQVLKELNDRRVYEFGKFVKEKEEKGESEKVVKVPGE